MRAHLRGWYVGLAGAADDGADADKLEGMGVVLHDFGEYDRAIEYHTKSLAIMQATLGEDHPNSAVVSNNLARARKQCATEH